MEDLLVPGAVVLLRTRRARSRPPTARRSSARRPPDADTHFRIASITKTMTSAVILQLAQEGKLALDDPVSKYIPDVPDGDNITLAQLLEMRSGLYSFTDDPAISEAMDDDPTRVWTPQELLDIAFAQPPMFAPGADYYYSNTNYVLLGLIIEQLEGRPLADVVRGAAVRAARHDEHDVPRRRLEHHPGAVLARLPVRQRLPRDAGHPATPRRRRRRPRPGPSAERLHRHQPLLLLRRRGRHLDRRRPRHLDQGPGSGKVLDAEYQRSGRTARRSSTPTTPTTGTGTASTSCGGAPTRSTSTAARPPASTRRRPTTPPTT